MSSKLTVIKGGSTEPPLSSYRKKTMSSSREYFYRGGFATNTRLMGVVALELLWTVRSGGPDETLCQIAYLDAETRNIDPYLEGSPDDEEMTREHIRMQQSMGGGLVEISEKEARFLIQSYASSITDANGAPVSRSVFEPLLEPVQTLTQDEYEALFTRLCDMPSTAEFSINYYIMRCASMDSTAEAWLCNGFSFPDPSRILPGTIPEGAHSPVLELRAPAVFCLNHIETSPDGTFLCETLTERGDAYYLTALELRIDEDTLPPRIRSPRRVSEFRITDAEAAMMTKRPEFISVYTIHDDTHEFQKSFSQSSPQFTETEYDTGTLYVHFNDTNDHVGRRTYRLNDDVKSVCYLTDAGQILIMGYSEEAAVEAEYRLLVFCCMFDLELSGRFQFSEPLLYEFINSGCIDFFDFIEKVEE